MCTKLHLNGSGAALANSIGFIGFMYSVNKLMLCSSNKKRWGHVYTHMWTEESLRDKYTDSIVKEVLKSDTSFLSFIIALNMT